MDGTGIGNFIYLKMLQHCIISKIFSAVTPPDLASGQVRRRKGRKREREGEGNGGKGRDRGRWRKRKQDGDRPPTIFGLNVALRVYSVLAFNQATKANSAWLSLHAVGVMSTGDDQGDR